MASAPSASLEAAMREIISDMIDGCKTAGEECSYLGISGDGMKINSRGKRYPIWTKHNASGGYRAEGGNYLTAGFAAPIAMRAFVTTFTVTAGYTQRFLDQVDGPDVVVDGLQEYMDRDQAIILDNKSQDMWEDGTGVKGVCAGAPSSGVITLRKTAAAKYFGAMKFMVGERVSFYSTADVIRAGGGPTVGTISAVDNVNTTITLSGSSGTDYPSDITTDDRIVREGSFRQAITGLGRAANNDSLDFQGLNRGTNPKIRAAVYDAASAPPDFDNLNVLKYRVRTRATKAKKRDVCTSTTIQQAVEQQGHALRRYTEVSDTQNLDYDKFKIDGSIAMTFSYIPADTMFFVDKDEIEWNVLRPLAPIDRDGSIFRLAPTSGGNYSDNWLVIYVEEADMGYKNTRNLGRAFGFDLTGLELPCDSADL